LENKKVVVFGRSNPVCPYCENAKVYLEENNISYEYKDISQEAYMLEFQERYLSKGIRSVPQISVDEVEFGGLDNITSVLELFKEESNPVRNVIKGSGEKVPFDAEKLNKKARWASDRKVNWSSISLAAFKRLHDNCTTKDIDKALLDTCVEAFDEKHFRLAGRILAGMIYKEAYGGFKNIPTLEDHHNSMVFRGYWENLPYSKEDFIKLEKELDHSKDLDYSYPEIKQINDKYVIRDRVAEKSLESPQMMYMGMAMANMKNMPDDRRLEDVIKLYHYLSDKKICAPTPFMTNLRTPSRSYASCATFTTNDTAESLAAGDHIAYMLTCASAGIGSHLKTRSKGDKVRGGTTIHQGKRPYYKVTESVVAANLQSSRGGSATMHLNVLDPEIMDILTWKSKKTASKVRVDGIHYSIGFNKLFAKYVKEGKEWKLISYSDSPEIYEALYDGDQTTFEDLFESYEGVCSLVPARTIAIEMLVQGQESGQIYLHRTDELNRHTPFKDKIYSSNLCVAPETQILTKQGYLPIAELEGESLDIWNGFEWSEVDVVKTGVERKLLKVETTSGYSLDCTPDHKFYIHTAYGKPYKEVRAKELQVGDKLMKFDLPVTEGSLELDKAYINGFYTADGTCSKGRSLVYLYHEKRKLEHLFGDVKWNIQEDTNRQIARIKGLKDKFFVPNSDYTVETRLAWLAGWLDGDGCVFNNGTNQAITGSSVEKEFLKEVQLMLQTLGVSAKVTDFTEEGMKPLPANNGSGESKDYWCRKSYRLLISSCDSYKLLQLGLKLHRLKIKERKPQRDAKQFVKIESVTDQGRLDDTYCFTEHKRNLGMFNGILTGQCQETAFPTVGFDRVDQLYDVKAINQDGSTPEIGLCSLSAVVARRVSKEEWGDVAYYSALMIDNVLDIMDYPFPSLKYTAQARRNIGVGITDLAGHMAEMKLPYSSLEGKKYMHTLAELHMFSLLKASVRLANERGVCEWSDRTKWAEGYLPIDTMNENIGKVVNQELLQDWEGLRKEIVATGGTRFSVHVNYMPNESSSVATNGTNSILPARSIKTVKTNAGKKTRFLVPNSDSLAEHYELAWDIKNKDMLDVYAIFQRFCDQSISADEYLDFTKNTYDSKKLLSNLLYMVAVGMKTRYYVNSKTNSGNDLNTVDEIEDKGCAGGGCSL